MLADGKTEQEIIAAMRSAIKSRGPGSQSVAALKEFANRVEGTVAERIEHTGADGEPLELVINLVKRADES